MPIFFILSCVLILLIIILGSYTLITQLNLNTCITNPAPYCYTDWKCLNPENQNQEINMSDKVLFGKSGIINNCFPLTSSQVNEFNYIDYDGNNKIVNPGKEKNIWALSCRKTTPNGCPNYKEGSIYWPACNGSPSSQYYVKPQIYAQINKN